MHGVFCEVEGTLARRAATRSCPPRATHANRLGQETELLAALRRCTTLLSFAAPPGTKPMERRNPERLRPFSGRICRDSSVGTVGAAVNTEAVHSSPASRRIHKPGSTGRQTGSLFPRIWNRLCGPGDRPSSVSSMPWSHSAKPIVDALVPSISRERIFVSPFPAPPDVPFVSAPSAKWDGRFVFLASEIQHANRDALGGLSMRSGRISSRGCPDRAFRVVGSWSPGMHSRYRQGISDLLGFRRRPTGNLKEYDPLGAVADWRRHTC